MFLEDRAINKINILGISPVDILVIGPTGAGKSSTINCLTESSIAIVGEGVNPQTSQIESYKIKDIFRLWDSPGLGDSTYNDIKYIEEIQRIIQKKCSLQRQSKIIYLIDLVLLIINGTSKDLSSVYILIDAIKDLISPTRVLVGINHADSELNGRYWNGTLNTPEIRLLDYISKTEDSIIKRLNNKIELRKSRLISYSAKYNYNIYNLVNMMIQNIPTTSRRG